MNRFLKFALIGVGGIVLLLVIVVAIVAATFNPNDYKPLVVKLVQEKKQRTLNIEGDIKLAFWPKIGADLGKISLSEHKSDKQFASVDGLKVSLALLPLLKKELVVDTIYVDGARANIIRYKDGTTNLDDLLSKDEEESEQIKFDIDGVNVSDSAVTFTDEQADATYALSKFNLKTGHVALAEPFDLATDFTVEASKPQIKAEVAAKGNFMADPEQKHYVVKGLDAAIKGNLADVSDADIKLSGDVDAKPETMEILVDGLKLAVSGKQKDAKLAAEVSAPKLIVEKNEVSGGKVSVKLSQEKGQDTLTAKLELADIKGSPKQFQSSGISGEVSAKQGQRTMEGKFNSPFTGNIEKLVFELPKLAGNIDIRDTALPNGGIKGTFALKAKADIKQEQADSDFSFNIDNTNLKGDVAVASFSKPHVRFNLNADTLDLNKLLGNKNAPEESKPSAASGGDKPTDLSALADLLLDGKVNIANLIYQQYKLSNLALAVKADGQQLRISPFSVKLDDTSIKGGFGISRFANPIYNFDLDIDKLDADRYIAKTDAKPASDKTPSAKSDPNAPIDLGALKKINANGELRIGWLKLANVKSTNVRIKLDAENGVANLSPFSANLYDGSMAGALKVDARNTPVIAFKQDMKGIAIGPLLTDAINNDMLSGKGTLNVDVTTQGSTVGALKKALNGKAAVNLADGAVKGIDIAGTLRGAKEKLNLLKSQGQSQVEGDKTKKTDFSEMVASFDIKNGVAHNQDLSMKSPLLRVTGSGDIDIANETIHYLAKPTVVASLKGQGGAGLEELNGVTVPVKVGGTFTKPSYNIDFAGLATAAAQKKVLDSVGGSKGEALKSLLGGQKKTEPAPATTTDPSAPAQPAPTEKPLTKEEKAKKKLNDLLGL